MGTQEKTNGTIQDNNLEITIEEGKIRKLIGYLENSNKVREFNYYTPVDSYWDYYYSLTGFLKGQYFSVTLAYSENGKKARISPATDCTDAIEELLKKFEIQPTEWYSQEVESKEAITEKEEDFKHELRVLSKEEVLANRSNAYEFIDFDKQETLEEISGSTGLKVRGFIHKHPIYDKNGNWNTDVEYGDTLICGFRGFGSECLKYGHRYTVINDNGETKLKSENGDIIDAWNTKNTMPFFVKIFR